MPDIRLELSRISSAPNAISPVFLGTPFFDCESLGTELGCSLSIKLETANPVRSFKGRGAELVMNQIAASGQHAVVCASAGNLGQALAWSGRRRDIAVTVWASCFAPKTKLQRMRDFGADVRVVDDEFEVARERAIADARQRGVRLVEDSLDIETCEGAATIGLELVKEPIDTVLIALGGGAMATGVGAVMKHFRPDVEVVCIQPEGAPALTRSFWARQVIVTDRAETIADGVAGRRPIPEVLADLLVTADDALLVKEASIIEGMRLLMSHAGLIVEPSAALGVAALLENQARFAGRRVATIVCGSNVDPESYQRWVTTGQP